MPFVIIGSRRTGSTHLSTTLSGHPEIFCNGNVFKKGKLLLFWPKEDLSPKQKKELLSLRERDPISFLGRVLDRGYGRPHVGFKIFGGQNDAILSRVINDDAVRKIILYRRNVLANYSSNLVAKHSGGYALKEGKTNPEIPKVEFSEREFVKFHDRYVGFYRSVLQECNDRRQVFHVVNYEELNDSRFFGGIVNFIGANGAIRVNENNQHKVLVKQNQPDIIRRFSNPAIVKAYLKKNCFMHWAQEGDTSLESLPEARA